MITLSVTPLNPIGFPSPPLNPFESPETEDPVINDVYEGAYFSFDLVYQLYDDLGGEPPIIQNIDTEIELLTYSTENILGLTAQKTSQNIITISGIIRDAFIDGFFKFVMPDGSLKILSPNTEENYLALVQWSPPTIKIIEFAHIIECKVINLIDESFQNDTKMFNQTVYWKFDEALTQFQSLI